MTQWFNRAASLPLYVTAIFAAQMLAICLLRPNVVAAGVIQSIALLLVGLRLAQRSRLLHRITMLHAQDFSARLGPRLESDIRIIIAENAALLSQQLMPSISESLSQINLVKEAFAREQHQLWLQAALIQALQKRVDEQENATSHSGGGGRNENGEVPAGYSPTLEIASVIKEHGLFKESLNARTSELLRLQSQLRDLDARYQHLHNSVAATSASLRLLTEYTLKSSAGDKTYFASDFSN
ncbi:MAG: hypothetical protein ACYDD1_14675 [Caulobacteraceae bacterium]